LLNEARNDKLALDASLMDALLQALDRLNEMMAAVGAATPLEMPSAALLQSLLPPVLTPVVAAPAPLAPAGANTPVNDDEFEALLDRMYGSAAPGVVTPAPSALTPAAGAAMDDDEFEALLDSLHGKSALPSAASGSSMPVAAPAPNPAPTAYHAAAAESSVRVDTARLDVLVNHAGELVLVRNRVLSLAARLGGESLATVAAELDRVTNDLQGAAMGMRMQPVSRLFQRFPRIVRDLARQLGKDVELVLEGEDTALDRSLVEALADPLIHLLRNALDHGVGMPGEREQAGKPRKGRICLSASQRGEHIVISVSDDGRGMDPVVLRRKAVEKRLISSAQAARLSEDESHELIFRPGFSTAAAVSEISGRGVGMDVVKTRVAELGGTLRVESQLGHGSKLELTVPLTLAVLRVLMVRVEERLLALPMGNVEEVFELTAGQERELDGRLVADHRDRTLSLADLSLWVGVETGAARHVVVLHIGHRRIGCMVDAVLGREDVIVKPLGPLFADVSGIAGATVTGDGRLALVLDLAGLAAGTGQPFAALQLEG
ncbi:MAG: chemotaxis protein CheA, partial [Rhodanobacter sp.]